MESEFKFNVEILDNGSVVRSDVEDVVVPIIERETTTEKMHKLLGYKIGGYVIEHMIPHIEESKDFNLDIEVKIKSKK